jgi:CubicO group peptidase (beta-lactamase class C family)
MRTRRATHTRLLAALFVISTLAAGCSGDKSPPGEQGIEGFWMGSFPEKAYIYVFECRMDEAGELTGIMHILEGDVKTSETTVEQLVYKNDHLSAIMHSLKVKYEGDITPDQQTIVGKFTYADGTSRSLILKRADESTVSRLYPRPRTGDTMHTYVYEQPERLDDGWETSSLNEEGVNDKIINECMGSIIDGKYGLVKSLLIVVNGKLVLEEYFYGFSRSTLNQLSSCTKGVASLLIGIAIDRGFIADVHDKLLTFFPEYSSLWSTEWEKVQLDHILTMTAGVGWDDGSIDEFYTQEDFFGIVFGRPIEHEPGEHFEYVSPNTDLLAGVIKTATGMHADEFAATYLFAPLGISTYDWDKNRKNGYPLMDGTLELLPRDIAKIGFLMLSGGVWQGKRIVSESWIDESTRAHITTKGPEYYGYLWWKGQAKVNDEYIEIIFASGIGSQFIVIIPTLDLVVVITGNNYTNRKSALPFEMVSEFIIPAVQ